MKEFLITVAVIFTIIVTIIFVPYWFRVISSTEVGVRSDWGKIQDEPLREGLNFYNPLRTNILKIDMRERVTKIKTETVSKEGLKFGIDITVRYRVKEDKPVNLVKNLQTKLSELINTYTNSTIDDVATGKDKNELYSDTGRTAVVQAVKDKLNIELKEYATISQVVFEDIRLPSSITDAIQKQQAALETIKEKENMKKVAEKEAEIRVIEAKGIADANNMIQRSLTREYLIYEAIQKLNPNAEKIYIPMNGLLPVITP